MIMTQTRMILFGLLGAIESDLRCFVREALSDSFLKNEDSVKNKARELYFREKKKEAKEDLDLLDFLYFGETYQILLANKEKLREDIRDELIKHREKSELIIPIRNRVAHIRPLEEDDFPVVNNFAQSLSKDLWPECKDVLQKIQKGTLEHFSNLPKTEEERACHNLPQPEFEETGFIGREKDVRDIKKLLYGHHPIITSYGEGGVGKTALMLKVAYDIIYDAECPFEYVVWITCKTAELRNSEIREIKNCIRDFSSMTRQIDDVLGGPSTTTTSETIESILNSVKEVKTLLILDNLETLQSEGEMQDFLDRCSEFGKIAITSRIGLGYLDYPRKLDPMKEKEAEKLLRRLAQVFNVGILYERNSEQILEYVKELFLNPLAIKWFVQTVGSGRGPDEVIRNKDSLREYCLSNIYDKFDSQQKAFLQAILVNAKPISKEELWFYTNKPDKISFENSLRILIRSSFIKIASTEDGYVYDLTEFARDYIHEEDRPSKQLYEEIRNKQNRIRGLKQRIKNILSGNQYQRRYIEIRKDSEAVLAVELSEALKALKAGDSNESAKMQLYKEALKKVNKVREIQPSYFEAYRISALIRTHQENYSAAEDDYREALKMEPDNPRIHRFYAGFLLRCKNIKGAKEHAEKAVSIDKESFNTRFFHAKCLGFEGEEYDNPIKKLKKLLNDELKDFQKHQVATQIIEFYKRKVESIKDKEKNHLKAWNVFLEGVNFFETLQGIKDKEDMEKKFVRLLDEGRQCVQDDEQRNSKLNRLKSHYIDLINLYDKRGYLLQGKPY